MKIASPMRYAGSRNKCWRYLLSLAPQEWTHFREPFTGSASMLLYLPKCEAWINDSNPAITRFHQTLRDDESFIPMVVDKMRELDTTEKKIEEFERVKIPFTLHRDPWATFMLNRFAAVNSVGFHRKNIASFCTAYTRCGFRPSTENNLRAEREALIRHNTKITTGDYYDVMTAPARAGEKVWIFLDPPYRMRHHASPYYEKMFSDEDHILLAERLKSCRFPWLLTINHDRYTERLYGSLGEVYVRRYKGCNAHQNRLWGIYKPKPWRTELIVRKSLIRK